MKTVHFPKGTGGSEPLTIVFDGKIPDGVSWPDYRQEKAAELALLLIDVLPAGIKRELAIYLYRHNEIAHHEFLEFLKDWL